MILKYQIIIAKRLQEQYFGLAAMSGGEWNRGWSITMPYEVEKKKIKKKS